MKIREVVNLLKADGWVLVATKGSHRQYKHFTKKGRVTVPGKLGDEITPGTLGSIIKQAGLKKPRNNHALRSRYRKSRK